MKLPKVAEYRALGKIMVKAVGAKECQEAYGTDDLYWIGRNALGYGDINQDGTLN